MGPIDSIVFDVDGVLVDVTRSFNRAIIETVNYFLERNQGKTKYPCAISGNDIAAFRRAGGFNDDWDLAYALIAISLAREKSGNTPAKIKTFQEIADMSGGFGLQFIRSIVPSDALPEYRKVRETGQRFYWGFDAPAEQASVNAVCTSDVNGLCLLEEPLVTSRLFEQFRELGVRKFGILTGRNKKETQHALRILGYEHDSPFDAAITSEDFSKLDPAALAHAASLLGTKYGVYVGDTGDDLQLVKSHSTSGEASGASFFAVIVASGPDVDYFVRAGADIVVHDVNNLPGVLKRLYTSPIFGSDLERQSG